MVSSQPAATPGAAPRSELALRIVSALVMAPLAIAAAWYGSWPFILFWGVASLAVFWEWTLLVAPGERRVLIGSGGVALVISVVFILIELPDRAAIMIVMGAFAAAAFAPSDRRAWAAGGVVYAGIIGLAPVLLRDEAGFGLGFVAIIMLFAVVWSTDIVAYFVGRAVGGPKLWPQVSPKKTWSGAIGGTAGAVGAALAVAHVAGLPSWYWIAAIAFVMSVVSQLGDLFESAIKRRFGAKDSGALIPGHGGLMDRLDGFVVAALVAALVGLVRNADAIAAGFLIW